MHEVHWLPRSLNQLASIWQEATEKQKINDCVEAIDYRLARDPVDQSESRRGNRRILFEAPLAVLLVILKNRRTVVVQSVWRFNKRRRKP